MRTVEPELRDNPRVKQLCRTLIRCAEDEELMLRFLRDLLAPGELRDISDRWAAATLLKKGHNVRWVAQSLGMAVATVSRVRSWVTNNTGGYDVALAHETDHPSDDQGGAPIVEADNRRQEQPSDAEDVRRRLPPEQRAALHQELDAKLAWLRRSIEPPPLLAPTDANTAAFQEYLTQHQELADAIASRIRRSGRQRDDHARPKDDNT